MNADRFDDALRSLIQGSSRRVFLHRLTRTAVGLATARLATVASAKKRKRKLKLNQFGCVNVGGTCRGKDAVCCSGICQGKKPKKGERDTSRCVAHDTGGCEAGQGSCSGPVACTTSLGTVGACFTTTGNAGYCAGGNACTECRTDGECQPIFGPRAACVLDACCPAGTACKGQAPD